MDNNDSTSFQSILNRAKRLRGENSASNDTNTGGSGQAKESKSVDKTSPVKRDSSGKEIRTASVRRIPDNAQVVNSFNQVKFSGSIGDTSAKNGFNNNSSKSNLSKTVMVNTTQKENPLLKHLVNTNWRYISSQPAKKIYYDYLIRERCVLFLTLTYHKLYVDYIERRMKPLQLNNNNILLFVIDDDSKSEDTINDLTKLCIFNGFTMLVAFNFEQAAKYIEYLNNS